MGGGGGGGGKDILHPRTLYVTFETWCWGRGGGLMYSRFKRWKALFGMKA